MSTTTIQDPALQEFIISRTFDAPRDLVWKSLTEPERIQQWFSPKGYTRRATKFELCPGGTYHFAMISADGKTEMWGKVVYREIEAPGRIVLINSFSDAAGGTTRHPMNANWPLEMHTTYLLAEDRKMPAKRKSKRLPPGTTACARAGPGHWTTSPNIWRKISNQRKTCHAKDHPVFVVR